MNTDELQERISRLRKATENVRQMLKYVDAECDNLQALVAHANQMELFEDQDGNLTVIRDE